MITLYHKRTKYVLSAMIALVIAGVGARIAKQDTLMYLFDVGALGTALETHLLEARGQHRKIDSLNAVLKEHSVGHHKSENV